MKELVEALGCEAYERCEGRRGYRNGVERRTLTTEIGTREVRVPRGRLLQDDGTTAEFHSEVLPRYARRTKAIDEAILGIFPLRSALSDLRASRLPSAFAFDENRSNEVHQSSRGYATIFHGKRDTSAVPLREEGAARPRRVDLPIRPGESFYPRDFTAMPSL
jgi:hypothetical protein